MFSKMEKQKSFSAQVCGHIRALILSGDLPPGTRLREAQLSAEMGVSRSPIREAFVELQKDGLLEVCPKQGVCVRRLTAEDVQQINTARGLVEGYLASLAAERATSQDIERLRSALAELHKAAERRDLLETANADFSLHRLIAEIAHHKLLGDFLVRLESQIRLYIAVQASLYEDFFEPSSLDSHQEVIEAIARHDGPSARAILEAHIVSVGMETASRMQRRDKVRSSSPPSL